MSDATMQAIEDAIAVHFRTTLRDDADPERETDMVVDWVVGYTISGVVDVEGKSVVGYSNQHIAPLGNPNAHIGLALWVADDIRDILTPEGGDDD